LAVLTFTFTQIYNITYHNQRYLGVSITTPLPVPMLTPLQEDGFSCVPRCIKMIFMYIQESYTECIVPDFDIDKIGSIVGTMSEGTLPEGVLNLNKAREISRARPSIEFEMKPTFHSIDELIAEVTALQPPIAWILSYDKERLHKFDHAVVVTGVENGQVCYNDPVFGKKADPIGDFLSKWDDEDRVLVKVKIGKRMETLEEYLGDFNKKNKQVFSKEGP